MKKHVILAFAISVLFLSVCGFVFAASASAHSSVAYAPPASTARVLTVCLILDDRQAQLSQEYQAANVQLAAAQAHGDQQQVGAAEKTLMRLRQLLAQVPAPCSSGAYALPVATINAPTVCQILHDRQAQLSQEYQAASAQLAAAQAHGSRQQTGEAEKTLMRLRQELAQVQEQLKAC